MPSSCGTDSSSTMLTTWISRCEQLDVTLLTSLCDCQQPTAHTVSLFVPCMHAWVHLQRLRKQPTCTTCYICSFQGLSVLSVCSWCYWWAVQHLPSSPQPRCLAGTGCCSSRIRLVFMVRTAAMSHKHPTILHLADHGSDCLHMYTYREIRFTSAQYPHNRGCVCVHMWGRLLCAYVGQIMGVPSVIGDDVVRSHLWEQEGKCLWWESERVLHLEHEARSKFMHPCMHVCTRRWNPGSYRKAYGGWSVI